MLQVPPGHKYTGNVYTGMCRQQKCGSSPCAAAEAALLLLCWLGIADTTGAKPLLLPRGAAGAGCRC